MSNRKSASPMAAGLLMFVVGVPVGVALSATALGAALVAAGTGAGGYLGQRWSSQRRAAKPRE